VQKTRKIYDRKRTQFCVASTQTFSKCIKYTFRFDHILSAAIHYCCSRSRSNQIKRSKMAIKLKKQKICSNCFAMKLKPQSMNFIIAPERLCQTMLQQKKSSIQFVSLLSTNTEKKMGKTTQRRPKR
jgi:hypothetical protein